MLGPIFCLLSLFVFQTLLTPAIRYWHAGLKSLDVLQLGLGPRDSLPEMSQLTQRSARALQNLQEALPVLLTLFLVCLHLELDFARIQAAAYLIVLSRTLYIPAYLSGTFGVRSFFWASSWVGIIMITLEIYQASSLIF